MGTVNLKWLGDEESNLDLRNQNPQYCLYTIPQQVARARDTGFGCILSTQKLCPCEKKNYSARERRRVRFLSLLILRRSWLRSWRASTVPFCKRMLRMVFLRVKI